MAGSLIKIDEEIVTSAVASVTLTGIDSTYDVYMVKFNNLEIDTDNQAIYLRVTKSGTADTTANYDRAFKELRAGASFGNVASTNATAIGLTTLGTTANIQANGVLYLFNFNSASEYSFVTLETTQYQYGAEHRGAQGGFVHTVASASDGIQFYANSGNLDSGTFTLYGLAK
jgi:hypothetical protein